MKDRDEARATRSAIGQAAEAAVPERGAELRDEANDLGGGRGGIGYGAGSARESCDGGGKLRHIKKVAPKAAKPRSGSVVAPKSPAKFGCMPTN
jgi:hypothetical protein